MEFINHTSYTMAEDIKRLRFITDHLPSRTGKALRVLEIGCGNGNISYQTARMGNVVTAIDISHTTIANALAKYGNTPGLTYKVQDAEKWQPSVTEKYDVIVCSEVLEHLFEPQRLVANFKNLLLPGGYAIVTVPNGRGPREALITRPAQALLKGGGLLASCTRGVKKLLGYRGENAQTSAESLNHVQFYTMKKLELLALSGGFSITCKKPGNFIENVFPYSLITRRLYFLQTLDCWLANHLPLALTSAFYMVWKPNN